jgi:hypothetical protein
MADSFFLHDINVYRNSAAYPLALNSPVLAGLLSEKAVEVVTLYRARVGRKTGRLRDSAGGGGANGSYVRVGGKKNDRIIGVVTIADNTVVADWKGKPFYYGEYHEEGTLNSRRAKRRTSEGRRPRPGYHELREVAQEWRI